MMFSSMTTLRFSLQPTIVRRTEKEQRNRHTHRIDLSLVSLESEGTGCHSQPGRQSGLLVIGRTPSRLLLDTPSSVPLGSCSGAWSRSARPDSARCCTHGRRTRKDVKIRRVRQPTRIQMQCVSTTVQLKLFRFYKKNMLR